MSLFHESINRRWFISGFFAFIASCFLRRRKYDLEDFDEGDEMKNTDLPVALVYTTLLKVGDTIRPQQADEFKNPYNSHIWIDEITFTAFPAVVAKLTGKALKMRFKVDNRFIVEDFVPFSLLAPRTDTSEDIATTAFEQGNAISVTWKMPKPFWVSKNENILMELRLDRNEVVAVSGDITQQATVNVAVKGRATWEVPKERFVPWVVSWRPDVFTTLVAPLVSPDEVLKNSRNQDVMVTRMLSDFGREIFDASILNAPFVQGDTWLTALISHSKGYYIVKQPTPTQELFSGSRRNLDIKFPLRPLEFLTVQLEIEKPTLPLITSPTTTRYYGGISLHGYSMEKVTAL